MGGIYVHIPFCGGKCSYCDFFSIKMSSPPFDAYSRRIIEELSSRVDELTFPVETLYFGGGTPSLLPPNVFTWLSENIRHIIQPLDFMKEFTIEVNPDDVKPTLVESWHKAGVNRISMGVQSMVDSELYSVGRRHNAATVRSAFKMLRNFNNISADIIFGLPGQTLETLEYSMKEVLELGFSHISIYNLMYEPGTILTHRRNKGMITPVDDDNILAMYEKICLMTADAGLRHYEISNYALPGFESKHNMSYWSGIPYIGLGAGAHSYDGKRMRRCNANNFSGYLEGNILFDVENLSDEELHDEYILTRLRTADGISLDDYSARFGHEATGRLLSRAQSSIAADHLKMNEKKNNIVLTEKGVMMSDAVILSLAE